MTIPTWSDLAGSLPSHQNELETSHTGSPSIAEQSATHGAPMPEADLGQDDDTKYAC